MTSVKLRTQVFHGYAVGALLWVRETARRKGGGRAVRWRIARFRAASAGAWYWWALQRAPVPGPRAAGLPWSPWRLRARSGPRG
jgi:hypothetical protein